MPVGGSLTLQTILSLGMQHSASLLQQDKLVLVDNIRLHH